MFEKVCTLSPEQAPEIRGFRLGMSREQVENKIPRNICSDLFVISLKSKDLVERELFEENEIKQIHKLKARETDAINEYKYLYCVFDDVSILNDGTIGTYPRNYKHKETDFRSYPDLDGITKAEFVFFNDILSRIRFDYESISDKKFNFNKKIVDNLGLSEWNNWEVKPPILNDEDEMAELRGIYKININCLECNKLVFKTIEKIIDKEYFHLFPSLVVAESPNIGMTSSQKRQIKEQEKQQKQQEAKAKEDKWKEEEKSKSDTFKP